MWAVGVWKRTRSDQEEDGVLDTSVVMGMRWVGDMDERGDTFGGKSGRDDESGLQTRNPKPLPQFRWDGLGNHFFPILDSGSPVPSSVSLVPLCLKDRLELNTAVPDRVR